MSHWKEISADTKYTTVETFNPNLSKSVATSSVSAALAALVDDIVSKANKPGLTSNLKQLQISSRINDRVVYVDQEGNGVQFNKRLDASKIHALIAAVQAAPEVE